MGLAAVYHVRRGAGRQVVWKVGDLHVLDLHDLRVGGIEPVNVVRKRMFDDAVDAWLRERPARV
jgi:hypothetical protein